MRVHWMGAANAVALTLGAIGDVGQRADEGAIDGARTAASANATGAGTGATGGEGSLPCRVGRARREPDSRLGSPYGEKSGTPTGATGTAGVPGMSGTSSAAHGAESGQGGRAKKTS